MTGLREQARDLFSLACRAADPGSALRAALVENPLPPLGLGGHYLVVSVGKAAVPMAEALLAKLPPDRQQTLIVTNAENLRELPNARVMVAGHPVPDAGGAAAALAVEAMLATATVQDRVIALISGGGSALLPAPVAGITLAEKAQVSQILLSQGFEITEMNLVRQRLSRLKGGGFLRAAAPAPVSAYILSDVIGDDLRVIASGPTVAPIGTLAQARALLQGRGVWEDLPATVRAHLAVEEKVAIPLPSVRNVLIGSNRKSLAAMATQGGRIVDDHLVGDVAQAAEVIIAAAQAARGPAVLTFGGETTVTLRGTGLGGRNQELALRVAMGMPDLGRDWAFLSGGTDGRDGPTEAAGGIVDAGSVARISAAGEDAGALLLNNDSNRALGLAGDLLVTGGTGTNVADVQILILGDARQ